MLDVAEGAANLVAPVEEICREAEAMDPGFRTPRRFADFGLPEALVLVELGPGFAAFSTLGAAALGDATSPVLAGTESEFGSHVPS